MNTMEVRIVDLQARLNSLVESSDEYTDDVRELYNVSKQLDELIVEYYKNIQFKLVQ